MKHEKLIAKPSWSLATEIDRVCPQVASASWNDIKRMFRLLERKFTQEFAMLPAMALETRRRIAESQLMAGVTKGLTFPTLRLLFFRLKELGFTNLDRRVTFAVIFARECYTTGHGRYGIRT